MVGHSTRAHQESRMSQGSSKSYMMHAGLNKKEIIKTNAKKGENNKYSRIILLDNISKGQDTLHPRRAIESIVPESYHPTAYPAINSVHLDHPRF